MALLGWGFSRASRRCHHAQVATRVAKNHGIVQRRQEKRYGYTLFRDWIKKYLSKVD